MSDALCEAMTSALLEEAEVIDGSWSLFAELQLLQVVLQLQTRKTPARDEIRSDTGTEY